MTIREYAKQKGVSYEAIRKQIARYKDDLDGHLIREKRSILLDDFAVEFLDDRRRESPVIVLNESEKESVERLKAQLEAVKNELIATQKTVITLQEEKQLMIEAKTKYDLLLESNTEQQKTIDDLRQDLQDAKEETKKIRKERDKATAEVKSFRKSVFGFYRKVKE